MKNLLKIIIVTLMFVTLLPVQSQAQQYSESQIMQMVENGTLSSTTIEKMIKQEMDNESYILREEQRRIDRSIEFTYITVIILLVIVSIIVLIVIYFRNLAKKDAREKEYLITLVDKGAIADANNENLQTIINAKKEKIITAQNKFLTDSTLLAIGFAVMFYSFTGGGHIDEFILLIAIILFFSGLLRLIVRTVFLIIETIKNRRRVQAANSNNEPIEAKNNDTQEEQQ